MSFMGGSACAAGSNPLAQMAKQQHVDNSLQFDRMQEQQAKGGMRSDNRHVSQQDSQMLQQMNGPQVNRFSFDEMRNELPMNHPNQANWSKDFKSGGPVMQPVPQPSASGSEWAKNFSQPQQQMPQAQYGPSLGMNAGMGYTPRFQMYSGMQQQPQLHLPQQQRIVELDDASWEKQFKSIEASQTKENTAEPELKTEDKTENKSEEVSIEDLEEDPVYSIENGYDAKWFETSQYPPNWDQIWDRIKDQMHDDGSAHVRGGDIWERDFSHFASSRPNYADYKFNEENPYLQDPDPYALGVALMDQGAKLSLAALAFEAALQRNPNHVDAWCRLGQAQAQNELENECIRALEQCVKLDKNNQQALLDLAISYTNEGYENAAYATLERWLATKYPQLVDRATADNPALANENRLDLHQRVTGLFLKAAQMSPDGANIDADVQVGLGVLFYGNEEYEKAVDCFRAALAVRPNDPLMWNRLGATLANSNKPEEAIDAYYKALELRPSFVRARYNVGVSCINIGCYREAAEHLLSAMSLHQTGDGNDFEKSTNLCETLRRVFLAMDRRDLVPKIGPNMDLQQFRSEFNF